MNIICLLKGHDLQFKEMLSPYKRRTLPSMAIGLFGEIRYKPPVDTGWLFYGYVATCHRCKKMVDADSLDLPLLYPK